jgi:hypothetical protein
MDMAKLTKALGKRRMAKVDDIMLTDQWVDIQLINGKGDCWDFYDFSDTEVIHYAKRFIDEEAA